MSDLYEKMAKGISLKSFEPDVLILGNNSSPLLVKDVLSTGLPNLDRIICRSEGGKWGLPVGRIISVKAKPAVGKTTFLLTVGKEAFKRGGAVAIIESEHALDLNYSKKICPMDKVLLSQPDTLEEAVETIKSLIALCGKVRSEGDDSPFLIIVDSFSGFTTEAELKGGGGGLGEHARIASAACRAITGPLAKAKALLLISHQPKSKIGRTWGNPETNIGGDAFNYHDSVCINMNRTSSVKNGNTIIGHNGRFRITKNKLYPPFQEVHFRIINGVGLKKDFSILDFLLASKHVVKKSGGNFHFKEDLSLKWQGADNFAKYVKMKKKAKKLIKKYINGN